MLRTGVTAKMNAKSSGTMDGWMGQTREQEERAGTRKDGTKTTGNSWKKHTPNEMTPAPKRSTLARSLIRLDQQTHRTD